MAEVEVHVHVVLARGTPVRHAVMGARTGRTVVATHVGTAEVMAVGRRVAGSVAVMGMVMVSVVGVVVTHGVAEQSPDSRSDKAHKRIATAEDRADQASRESSDQASISRTKDAITAAAEAGAPSSLGNIGVKECISVNDRHTVSLL